MSEMDEMKRLQAARARGDLASFGAAVSGFDQELYGGSDKTQYVTELVDEDMEAAAPTASTTTRVTAASMKQRGAVEREKRNILRQGVGLEDDHDPMSSYRESRGSGLSNTKIADRCVQCWSLLFFPELKYIPHAHTLIYRCITEKVNTSSAA
jgi:hypothetical protein